MGFSLVYHIPKNETCFTVLSHVALQPQPTEPLPSTRIRLEKSTTTSSSAACLAAIARVTAQKTLTIFENVLFKLTDTHNDTTISKWWNNYSSNICTSIWANCNSILPLSTKLAYSVSVWFPFTLDHGRPVIPKLKTLGDTLNVFS